MSDKAYSKREIDSKFLNVSGIRDEQFKDLAKDVKEILIRITIQNGKIASLEKWRSYILGGLSILSLLTIPILIRFLSMK